MKIKLNWILQLFQSHSHHEKNGIVTLMSGLAIIAVILFMQYLSTSSLSTGGSKSIILSVDKNKEFDDAAVPTFAMTSVAVCVCLIGVNRLLNSWKDMSECDVINLKNSTALQRTKILIGTSWAKERKAFWLSLFFYAIIFMLSSGMAIYSQENISNKYGVTVPSYYVTGCCGQPGSYPVLTAYTFQHFGLMLVPMNLVLISFIPLLVAINISAFIHRSKFLGRDNNINNKNGIMCRNVSICGISAGMLAGCPTCTGSILFSLVGTGSLSSIGLASSAISGYQPLFVTASIGMLLAAPIVSVLTRKR